MMKGQETSAAVGEDTGAMSAATAIPHREGNADDMPVSYVSLADGVHRIADAGDT